MMKKYMFLRYLSHFKDDDISLPPDSLLTEGASQSFRRAAFLFFAPLLASPTEIKK